ncbi:MAG TPA: hypothetical protein EYP31_00035 [Roseibacterium sp.]|nr:hypothetical protein [Roseibacterium sp.]
MGLALILSFLGVQLAPAYAGIVSTESLLAQEQIAVDKSRLQTLLERQGVQNQLAKLGVNAANIEKRVANLTPSEVALLNDQLADIPAGGDGLGLIVLIFVIFVITDVIGATDIFPFVHPVR